MHKIGPEQRWNPLPPEHTQPWGGWATHEMISLRARLADLQQLLEEVTDEMDRRADLIEAEKKNKTALTLLTALLANPALPYFAALALLTSTLWLSGNKQVAIDIARDQLSIRPK
jgi:hypothetical protein